MFSEYFDFFHLKANFGPSPELMMIILSLSLTHTHHNLLRGIFGYSQVIAKVPEQAPHIGPQYKGIWPACLNFSY